MTMLGQLETLVVLSELGTMQRAAVRLRVTQSAVSKRVAALEAELGARLVERTGRHVRLTARAQLLCERARPLLAEVRRALEDGGSGEQRLTLGISDSVLASFGPALLKRALLDAPQLRLTINAHRSPLAVDLVRSGEYALALVAGRADQVKDLLTEALCHEAMVIVGADEQAPGLRAGRALRLATIEPRSATWRAIEQPLSALCRARRLRLELEHPVQSFTALTQLALHGFFHALVPLGVARALRVSEARLRRLPAPGLFRPLHLVGRKSAFQSPAIACFAAALSRNARELDLT
jgi:DNA-binding transcriptional LysR family regulator